MFTSTLLSPQYASWLVPFAAIEVVYGDRLLAELTGAVVALSVLDIVMLDDLVAGNPGAIAVVVTRNVLVVVLYAVAARRIVRLYREPAATPRRDALELAT